MWTIPPSGQYSDISSHYSFLKDDSKTLDPSPADPNPSNSQSDYRSLCTVDVTVFTEHQKSRISKLLMDIWNGTAPDTDDNRRKLHFQCLFKDQGEMLNAVLLDKQITRLDLTRRMSYNDDQIGAKEIGVLCSVLKSNEAIKECRLGGHSLGDEAAQIMAHHLETDEKLTYVDLYDNSIGDAGVIALAESLEKNKTLTRLDLSGNRFSKVGARALVDSIKKNHTLTDVRINGNTELYHKVDSYIEEISEHFRNNRHT